MRYRLYTTIDITHTGHFRPKYDNKLHWQEQNFQTVLQTLGIRGNINFSNGPEVVENIGFVLGFPTAQLVRAWQFDFDSEQSDVYELDNNSVGFLEQDFNGVPYISGLEEKVHQNYDVFVTDGKSKNIVFQKIQ